MNYPANWLTALLTYPLFWVFLAGLGICVLLMVVCYRKGGKLPEEKTNLPLSTYVKTRLYGVSAILSMCGIVIFGTLLIGIIIFAPNAQLADAVEEALQEKYDVTAVYSTTSNAFVNWETAPVNGRTVKTTFKNCWVTLNDTPENITVMCPTGASEELVDLNTLTNLKTNTVTSPQVTP